MRTISNEDEETTTREEVILAGKPAAAAVQSFLKGETDLVLGGTFGDLPYARADKLPKAALRFDPAAGLFGLVPARASGPAADPEIRQLLSQAIDRQALIDALNVPGAIAARDFARARTRGHRRARGAAVDGNSYRRAQSATHRNGQAPFER